MFSSLSEFDRLTLLRPAIRVLRPIKQEKIRDILVRVGEAFDAWKQSLADKRGRLPFAEHGNGLLGYSDKPREWRSPEDVELWQIHGQFIRGRIDLAMKLWAENFSPFMRVADEYGIAAVLSVVALSEKSPSTDALIPVSGVLWDFVAPDRGARGNGGKKGSAARGRGKTSTHLERKTRLQEAARQRHLQHPDESLSNAAIALQPQVGTWWRIGGKPITAPTIARYLSDGRIFGNPKPRKAPKKA